MYPGWEEDFWAFSSWIELNLGPREDRELDRINNDGNYEPGNVRWATRSEQLANRRWIKETCPSSHLYELYGFQDTRGRQGCRECRREQNKAYRKRHSTGETL